MRMHQRIEKHHEQAMMRFSTPSSVTRRRRKNIFVVVKQPSSRSWIGGPPLVSPMLISDTVFAATDPPSKNVASHRKPSLLQMPNGSTSPHCSEISCVVGLNPVNSGQLNVGCGVPIGVPMPLVVKMSAMIRPVASARVPMQMQQKPSEKPLLRRSSLMSFTRLRK